MTAPTTLRATAGIPNAITYTAPCPCGHLVEWRATEGTNTPNCPAGHPVQAVPAAEHQRPTPGLLARILRRKAP